MIELHKGDCLEVMREIETNSIDAIICDLPYGTTQNKWDSIIDLPKLWEQYERVIKERGVIVLFAQIPFSSILGASNIKMLKYEWIWQKDQGTGHLNAKKRPMKNHENILVFYKKFGTYNPQKTTGHKPTNASRKNDVDTGVRNYGKYIDKGGRGGNTDRYPLSIYRCNTINGFSKTEPSQHPTQKPIALMKMLVKTYSNENDTILDNTMGSGSTGVACKQTNRNFIGIEQDKNYFEIAQQRINSTLF
jgi:DNA modification methylase